MSSPRVLARHAPQLLFCGWLLLECDVGKDKPMKPEDFLTFKKMITPTIIQILFWILAGLAIILGLAGIVSGATSNFGGGTQVLGGLVMLVLGPLAVRVYCEILIVIFRMNQTLVEIRDSLPKQQQ
jgi:hypothetical protein